MRKKFTMLLASLFLVMGTGVAQVYQKVPHTKWTVTALNEAGVSGNEGGVDFIKDENPQTFYHSNWGAGYEGGTSGKKKGQDGVQAFLVEMGEVYTLDRITYTGRSNGPNNWATKVRIYIYESLPEGCPANLSTLTYQAKEALLSKDNTKLGTPAFSNADSPWANDQNMKTVDFATPQTGKYILFVADATTGSNGYFTCSDFHVWQKLEGIVEDKPYFLKINGLDSYYLDTRVGENSNYGNTICKTQTPVATYFTLNDGYWHVSSLPGNERNFVGIANWDAIPGKDTPANWTLHKVDAEHSLWSLAQSTYYGSGDATKHYLGANDGNISGNTKVYTDKTIEQAVKFELVELTEEQTTAEATRVAAEDLAYAKETATAWLNRTGAGYPAADSEARITLQSAINAADATKESIDAALVAYQAHETVVMPEVGKVYRLVSGYTAFTSKKALYSDNNELKWQNKNDAAMNQLWTVQSMSNGNIVLMNVNDALYPQKTDFDTNVTMFSEKNECSINFCGKGQFQVFANKQQRMFANGHSNGNGASGNIKNYNDGEVDSYSSWYFEEVSITKEVLSKQIESLKAAYIGSLLVKQESVVGLQTAVNAAQEVCNAEGDYAAAFASLVATLNTTTIDYIEQGYFRMKSKEGSKYAYNDNTSLKATTDKNSPKTIIKLTEANNGTFYIQNGNGYYAQGVSQSTIVNTAASPLEYVITRLASDHYVLRPKNSTAVRGFWHQDGSSNVVGWSSDAGNTQWTFEALTVEEAEKIYAISELNVSSADVYVTYNGEGYTGDKDVKQAGGFYVLDNAPTTEDFTVNNVGEGMISSVVVDGKSLSVNAGYDGKNIYTLRCMKGNSYARYHSGCQLSADDATNMLTYEGQTHYESLFFIEKGTGDNADYYTIRSVAAPTMYAYNLKTANEDSKVAMKEAPAEGGLTDAYYWKISSFGEVAGNITPKGGDAFGWNKRGSYNGMNHIGFWQGGNGSEDNKWFVRLVEEEFVPSLHSVIGYPTEESYEEYLSYAQFINQSGFNKLKNPTWNIILPEAGKYYRFSHDYGTGGVKYVQAIASNAPNKKNALLMSEEQDIASIFYYGDDKLRSYSTGLYVNDKGGNRGLQAEGGAAKFEKGTTLGKLGIFAGDSFHANQDGDIYFIDHCGSVHSSAHDFTVEEVDMTSVIAELNALAGDATAAAALGYLTDEEKIAFTTAAATMTAAATTLNDGGFVKDMTTEMAELDASIDAAMDVMTHYDLAAQPFRLKQTASGLYMVASNGAKIAAKAEGDASSQAFNLVTTATAGVYNLKSVDGLYMQVNSYSYLASAEGEDENKVHEIEYIGRGKYNIKTTSGYVASDDIAENSTLWSNKAQDNANGVWEIEPLATSTFTYRYKYNDEVKRTETALGYVGCPYPAPALNSVYGVEPTPKAGNVSADDNGVTFDMEYTIDLPFQFADSYDNIEHWYFMKIRDDGFTYMGYDAEKSYIRANQSNVPVASKDAYTWGFVGNPFDGFSIVNYATGKTKVLSAPVAPTGNKNATELARMVEVTNEYTGNLVWNFKAPTHPNPKPSVFYIEHPTATSYAFNRQDYDGAKALCYWDQRDTGSAVQVVERGVFNLDDLKNQGIYALQAERSPLMYSTTEGMTTKLSSGMVDDVSANANDINQQFIIYSSKTDGAYYLYSLGANKFVDADLNFTDYPEPVLSFEANANNAYYPWYVKINDKFVVPGDGGTAGNKLFHTSTPAEDEGKRYRIIKVGENISIATGVASIIEHADGLIKDASDLSNSKVYTVSTYDRGVWSYNAEKDALWYAASVNRETKTEQFAFLTVGGRTYLYSVGAGKFVVKSGDYTAYSDVPSQPVEILKATGNKFFPLVVALTEGSQKYHIGISPTYEPPVITFYENLGDDGNKVDIREAGELENSAEILATMDAYLAAQTLVPELEALIARAEKALTYLLEADKEALATAKTDAENVLAGVYDSEMLGTQITALTTALNAAILVDDYAKFKNNYVYSFVTSRGWVGADANSENLIGTANSKVDPAPTPSEDNSMFQWAVYKSESNRYYMYNIGKGKFMGMPNGEPIPFADAPQSLKTTFKNISGGVEYPIMLSPDNVGAVSQNGNAGLFYWNGGWNRTDDAGSNHKVTVVGAITESTLATIAEAVELYEEICELGDALADADNRLDDALGYYSCTAETQAELAAIEEFMTTATDVAEVNVKTARVNELIATFTLNVPQAGKFYRIKNNAGNGYLSSGESGRTQFKADIATDASSIFGYIDGKLLSYKNGMYIHNDVGQLKYAANPGEGIAIDFVSSLELGKLQIHYYTTEDRYLYSGGTGNTDAGRDAANTTEARYRFTVEEVTTLPVTVTAAQVIFNEEQKYVSTLFAPVALEVPAGITAYIGVNEDNYLSMEPIKGVGGDAAIIPANTGVILMADAAKTYDFAISSEAGTAIEAGDNIIAGTVAKTIITPVANTTCYVLAKKDEKVGLYRASLNKNDGKGFINNACKAYIPVETPAQAAPALVMRFGRGQGTTEIELPTANGQQPTAVYDLQGRRVLNPTKGMYIVNGKKVVIR